MRLLDQMGTNFFGVRAKGRRGMMNWVGNSLEGYYTSVRRAIVISLVLRAIVTGWVIRWIAKKLVAKIRGR